MPTAEVKLIDTFVPAGPSDVSLATNVADKMMTDRQYLQYHRPFLPTSGPNQDKPCVVINLKGRDGQPLWTTEKGEKVPLMGQVPIFKALEQGAPIPLWALNATSLRRDDWIQIDREVQTSYRNRLKLIADLQSRVSVGGFNGWGKLTYEYDAMSDAHEAVMDMDGLTEARNDAPLFLPRSLPLPFTHSDFYYSDRLLAVSRSNGGTGLDIYSSEQCARRVAELVEDTAIGITTGVTYGGRTG